jgi:hypothetical protein
LREFTAGVGQGMTPDRDRDEVGARRGLGLRLIDLEDGQESDSELKFTARAGTTVEIACL